MAQRITVDDSACRFGRDVCAYGCVGIWWLGVCISMRIVCMHKEVVCMNMGMYAYGCVCIGGLQLCVCMYVSFV